MDHNFPNKFREICDNHFDKRSKTKKELLKESTKHALWSMMKKIIKFGYDQEWIKKNYMSPDYVFNPYKESGRRLSNDRLINQDEYFLFLSELSKENYDSRGIQAHLRVFAMELGVSTGMRLGEVFGIRYESIDIENKNLFINLQWCKVIGKKGFILKTPKKGSSRTIGLTEYIANNIYDIHQN